MFIRSVLVLSQEPITRRLRVPTLFSRFKRTSTLPAQEASADEHSADEHSAEHSLLFLVAVVFDDIPDFKLGLIVVGEQHFVGDRVEYYKLALGSE